MKLIISIIYIIIFNVLLWFAQVSWARVKLVALSEREATVVRLDNPRATLLEEERQLTLQKGMNSVDFSWKGVEIVPDSVHLTVLEPPDSVTVQSVSYPPNQQTLVWQMTSTVVQPVRVRMSYLLKQIDRLVTYDAVVNKAESALDLTAWVVLRNFSGENLPLTQFQLNSSESLTSEILSGETKRIVWFMAKQLPLKKYFTFDAAQLPWDPQQLGDNVGIPVHYELENTPENGLGKQALWEGKVRLYAENSHGNHIFLGEDYAQFTPVGQTLQLMLSDNRDVVITQKKIGENRFNERRDKPSTQVVLYDLETTLQVKLENFTTKPAWIRLKELMPEEWEMKNSSHPYERQGNQEIIFDIPLPAKQKVTVTYNYIQRNIRP
jgi:hypothetical protein